MTALIPPTKARWTISRVTTLVASAALLAACARDVAAPTPPTISTFAPTSASLDLSGAKDGTYTWTVDNSKDSPRLTFGSSYIVFSANSICDPASSGYGVGTWDQPCTPLTGKIQITATVSGALTNNPSVQFTPALRFNPATTVTLLIAASNSATLSNMTKLLYCTSGVPALNNTSCYDESSTDPSLAPIVNTGNKTITRRVKHFSGYLVSE